MAKDPQTEAPPAKAEDPIVDDFAAGVFRAMGYSDPPPPDVARVYSHFKRRKDSIQPGRLSADGFAFVVTLVEVASGRLPVTGA